MPTTITSNTNVFTDLIANAPSATGGTGLTDYLNTLSPKITDHDELLKNSQQRLKEIASSQNVVYTMNQDESNRLIRKKNNIDQALDGQNRMITLNDSYVKKYAKYNQIVMVIVLVILAILGAIMLGTYVPAVPSVVNDLIMILAVGIGLIVIYNIYTEIQKRDSMYFDKLNTSIPDISGNLDLKNNDDMNAAQWDLMNGGCMGGDCCGAPPVYYIDGKCRSPPASIWNYGLSKGVKCDDQACSLPVVGQNGATQDTYDNEVKLQTWRFDKDRSQWVNDKLNQFWNFNTNAKAPIPAPLPDAPVVETEDESFRTMENNNISTIDNIETGYSYYK
jgi:hypothetical protein